MKSRQAVRAIAGVLLCVAGLWLALPTPYRERTFLIDAGGCRLETTIVEKPGGAAQGSVVLFHGISANKKIMSYFARGLAEQGLRVYVPDLPGHGRTRGRFLLRERNSAVRRFCENFFRAERSIPLARFSLDIRWVAQLASASPLVFPLRA